MPVYELFCLARPALAHAARSDLLQSAAAAVTTAGGFLIDYKNYGERKLAYPVRSSGTGDKYAEAFIWQMAFSTPATALPALERTLSLDDRVLRSVVLKRRAPGGPAPTPAAVARRAHAALAGQAVGAALAGHKGPGGQQQQ